MYKIIQYILKFLFYALFNDISTPVSNFIVTLSLKCKLKFYFYKNFRLKRENYIFVTLTHRKSLCILIFPLITYKKNL